MVIILLFMGLQVSIFNIFLGIDTYVISGFKMM